MIQVLIELHPHGDATKARPLGLMLITNDGTGDAEYGNYRYTLSHAGKFFGGTKKEPFKQGRVKKFKRTLSPYRLVQRCLKDAGEV
jgi:hypothetical protein